MSSIAPLDPLALFHPLVAGWFKQRFGTPTLPQRLGWPEIASGKDVLIAAPTGSGKTLAAFLACIDRAIRDGLSMRGQLAPPNDAVDVLYISPLKALSNDIHRNLETPLGEIRELAASQGLALPPLRVAVRTGDTPAAERARMAKKPPHILVTTPESLYILLTAKSSRKALCRVRTVIIDEIHAVADNKRGAHLTLSLERLDRLTSQTDNKRSVRIGLSATQRPIERIARMLAGNHRDLPVILDSGHARTLDIAIESTDDELGAIASTEQFGRTYDRIAELVRAHQTTIVFVNTRRLVERVSHHLEERLGEEQVVAHHGSLSRKLRFAAERKLKSGQVKCAVATASLELGIDVGAVDLVIQLGSPRSIATLLQRIGRSGHSLGKTPKGRLFAMTRDQLIECAALVRAIKCGALDEISLREAPLDILAQQIVATVACEDMDTNDMFDLVRGSAHYRDLKRSDYDQVITMLSEGVSTRRGRSRTHIFHDRIGGVLKARRGARLVAVTNGGAIGDIANYPVVLYPDDTPVGTLDEDFAIESLPGDIFLLGNTSWRIRRVEATRVLVDDAKGMPPNIPFWIGEAPARTEELSNQVSRLREDTETRILDGQSNQQLIDWFANEACVPSVLAEQAIAYLVASRNALGALPTRNRIIVERFFDNAGGMQLVLHAPLGGRINKAWGLALRKRFCRSFNFELQAAATDDGIVISLGPPHSFVLESVFRFIKSQQAKTVLEQAVLAAPVFTTRWRWASTRSLAVQRRFGSKKVPPPIVRMRTDDLLTTVFPMQQACLENVVGDIELPDHPLVKETMRDCLTEFMDVDGFTRVIERLETNDIEMVCCETTEPSPLSHELISANPYAFLDDAPLEERRTRAVSLPRGLAGLANATGGEVGVVSDQAIATAEDQAHPPVRDADELHDVLHSLYLAEEHPQWRRAADILIASGRATRLHCGQATRLVAAERQPLVLALYPDATCEPELAPLPFELDVPDPETVAMWMVRGHLEILGPTTAAAISAKLPLPLETVRIALGHLEADGAILRGRFSSKSRLDGAEEEVCDRRMLARIHRLTLAKLRRQVEPVSAATLMRFLFRWQRLGTDTKLIGIDGVAQIIEQLQGFQSAAGSWERDLLPSRLHAYEPSWLDTLCLSGQVSWARLSPKLANPDGITLAPTKAAPLTIMMRADMTWLRASATAPADPETDLSNNGATVYTELEARGARFLPELARTLKMKATLVEAALWELVSAGLATADGFASLRVLTAREPGQSRSRFDVLERNNKNSSNINTKHKRNKLGPKGRWRQAIKKSRRRDAERPAMNGRSLAAAAGRWSLLESPSSDDSCVESWARLLLHRYGVIFRDLLARESGLPPWRELLTHLRRLEARGEIRGGRFVSGFVGEQFALPEALDGLRALRSGPRHPELVIVAATDPLNLVGVTSAGNKVAAVIGNRILFRNGTPIASIEAGKLVHRVELGAGESISEDLEYRGPAPIALSSFQAPLPF